MNETVADAAGESRVSAIESRVSATGSAAEVDSVSPLRKLAIRGSAWTLAGYGFNQGVRLAGNVVVAWLLFPEAFGIMGVTFSVLTGLTMFSDVGLGPNIIQNKRGEDPHFLRTAWTVQVFRGLLIFALTIPLGWVIYFINGQPIFIYVIPVAGLTSVLSGLNSVSIFTYNRRLQIKRITLLQVAANSLGMMGMILAVWLVPSVWSLLASGFIVAIVRLAGSYWYLPDVRMGFEWDTTAVRELVRFGRWIFVSTALTFMVVRLDIFILSGLVGMGVLGLYNIAKSLALAAVEALGAQANTVLLPVYSRLSDKGQDHLRKQTLKLRMTLMAVFLPPLWALAVGGGLFFDMFYDDRYAAAGWMLKLMAAGTVASVVCMTIEPVLLAKGNSFGYMLQLASRLGLQIVGMTIGAYYGGTLGFIIGLAVADLLNYPVLAALVRKYGVWLPALDGAAYAVSALVIGAGWLLL